MGVTQRQHDCLSAINAFNVNGVEPTFSRIAALIGTKSKGRVAELVAALEERGAITRTKYQSKWSRRGVIALTPAAIEYLSSRRVSPSIHDGALAVSIPPRTPDSERKHSTVVR